MAKQSKQKKTPKKRAKQPARTRKAKPSPLPKVPKAEAEPSPAPPPAKEAAGAIESVREMTPEELLRATNFMREYAENVKPEEVKGIADGAREKAKGLFGSAWAFIVLLCKQVWLLAEMLYDWLTGKYPLPWRTVAAAAGALAYFWNTIDVFPDFIPVFGLVDDAGVVGLTFRLIREDLLEYCKFRGLDPKEYGLE